MQQSYHAAFFDHNCDYSLCTLLQDHTQAFSNKVSSKLDLCLLYVIRLVCWLLDHNCDHTLCTLLQDHMQAFSNKVSSKLDLCLLYVIRLVCWLKLCKLSVVSLAFGLHYVLGQHGNLPEIQCCHYLFLALLNCLAAA